MVSPNLEARKEIMILHSLSSRILSLFTLIYLLVIHSLFCVHADDCALHKGATQKEKQLLERLSPLKNAVFKTDEWTTEVQPEKKYDYVVAICKSTNPDNPKLNETGALQQDFKSKENYTLGKFRQVGLVSGTNWILMTYYGGDRYQNQCDNRSRMANIMIICDPSVEKGSLRLLVEGKNPEQSHCFYMFELSSLYACDPTHPEDTISGGGIFCILFFTTAGLYLLGGFLYQRMIVGAKGLEQIPNYAFWRDFGNLQADGCNFLCRCGPRHESQAYRGIDDRLPKENDRDDQLLSM